MSQKRRVYATNPAATNPVAAAYDPNVAGAAPGLANNPPTAWPSTSVPASPSAGPSTQPMAPLGAQSLASVPAAQPQLQQATMPSLTGPQLFQARPYDPIPLPEFIRLTLRTMPSTEALLKRSGIPLGAIIHPLPFQYGINETVPVVDMGSIGIVRCRRCRGYINPFARFIENGSRWQCNLCGLVNETPGDYYSPIDNQGLRQDRHSRPELSQCVVEFVAPAEYMVRPPMAPVYFFVIDVSYSSVAGGFVDIIAQSIQYVLNTLAEQSPDGSIRVGFITFDSRCHFYNLRPKAAAPQMLVVSPPENAKENIYVPTGQDLLVNLVESKPSIDMLLSTLPEMFKQSKDTQSCLGSALQAAYRIMEPFGGKLFVFAATAPTLGPASHDFTVSCISPLSPAGSVIDTQRITKNAKLIGTPQEAQLLTPNESNGIANWYRNYALECSKQQICVDLFAAPPSTQLLSAAPQPTSKAAGGPPVQGYLDLATLSLLPEVTGGQVWHYPSFHPGIHGQGLSADIVAAVQRQTAWEAVMRVRCSKGVHVAQHFGHFFIRSTDLLALPACDAHKAFSVQLEIQSDLVEVAPVPGIVTLQAALLYTNQNSERRIRVITVGIPVSTDLSQVFNSVDVPAVITLTAKFAIQRLQSASLNDARDAVVNKTIEIITAYQKGFGGAGGSQLVLPESLKSLPLYSLALVKSSIVRLGQDLPPDVRMNAISLLRTLPTDLLIAYIYPRFFALHNLAPEVGVIGETGIAPLPPAMNLSAEKLERVGVFLLDNGVTLNMFIGSNAPQELLEQMFAIPGVTAQTLDPYQAAANLVNDPNEAPDSLRNRVSNVLNSIRAERPCYQPLIVLTEKDVRVQSLFFERLVEDRTRNVFSYYEYVQQLQKAVNKNIKG